jgi:hypothetical protein
MYQCRFTGCYEATTVVEAMQEGVKREEEGERVYTRTL